MKSNRTNEGKGRALLGEEKTESGEKEETLNEGSMNCFASFWCQVHKKINETVIEIKNDKSIKQANSYAEVYKTYNGLPDENKGYYEADKTKELVDGILTAVKEAAVKESEAKKAAANAEAAKTAEVNAAAVKESAAEAEAAKAAVVNAAEVNAAAVKEAAEKKVAEEEARGIKDSKLQKARECRKEIDKAIKQCNSYIDDWVKEKLKKSPIPIGQRIWFVVAVVLVLIVVFVIFWVLPRCLSSAGSAGPDVIVKQKGKDPITVKVIFHEPGLEQQFISAVSNMLSPFFAALAAIFKFNEDLLVLQHDRMDSGEAEIVGRSNIYRKKVNRKKLQTAIMIIVTFAAALLPIQIKSFT